MDKRQWITFTRLASNSCASSKVKIVDKHVLHFIVVQARHGIKSRTEINYDMTLYSIYFASPRLAALRSNYNHASRICIGILYFPFISIFTHAVPDAWVSYSYRRLHFHFRPGSREEKPIAGSETCQDAFKFKYAYEYETTNTIHEGIGLHLNLSAVSSIEAWKRFW